MAPKVIQAQEIKEEKEITEEEMSIANCVCCLLAVNMRTCNICKFNIGLEKRSNILSELSNNNVLVLEVI